MDRVYFKGTNGKIYTDYKIKDSLDIIYGGNHSELTEEDIINFILQGKIVGIEPAVYKPSIEDFIKSGNKVDAVREYYYDYNEKNPNNKISIKEAKSYIDNLEKEFNEKDTK